MATTSVAINSTSWTSLGSGPLTVQIQGNSAVLIAFNASTPAVGDPAIEMVPTDAARTRDFPSTLPAWAMCVAGHPNTSVSVTPTGTTTTTTTSAYPDNTNTGVTPGTVLTASAGFSSSADGQVFQGLDITGQVYVGHNNVKFKDCRITCNAASFYGINAAAGTTGLVVDTCEINGTGLANPNGPTGIVTGTSATITNCKIYGVENGFAIGQGAGPTLIKGNYVFGLLASGTPHYDCIQVDGNISNLTIQHNTLLNPNNQSSVVMLDNGNGPLSNILVTDNAASGGGYIFYCDNSQGAGAVTNVSFTNNRLGTGAYGPTAFYTSTVTYTGNTFDGATIIGGLKTTGNDFSSNKPTVPNVGAAFGGSGPYAGYVLVATVPAAATRNLVAVENTSGSQLAIVRDDGLAASGSAPASASVFSLAGGVSVGAQGGAWTSTTFKGRVQVYAPVSSAQVAIFVD